MKKCHLHQENQDANNNIGYGSIISLYTEKNG